MSRPFRRWLARHRRNRIVRRLARHAASWLRGYENFDYDPRHNGERFLLETLARVGPADAVLFDVGANRGDWTAIALAALPGAAVHGFEIVPATAAAFAERFADDARVRRNRFGLAERDGTVAVNAALDDDTRSTLLIEAPIGARDIRRLECPVRTGDGYCAEHGIAAIDLLKIDVEGAEHLVLAGFERLLDEGRIGAIQFEYGRHNLSSRYLLADFYASLEPRGFTLGKLYPDYVDFAAYAPEREDFLGPNQVAVHASRAALRRALAGGDSGGAETL